MVTFPKKIHKRLRNQKNSNNQQSNMLFPKQVDNSKLGWPIRHIFLCGCCFGQFFWQGYVTGFYIAQGHIYILWYVYNMDVCFVRMPAAHCVPIRLQVFIGTTALVNGFSWFWPIDCSGAGAWDLNGPRNLQQLYPLC